MTKRNVFEQGDTVKKGEIALNIFFMLFSLVFLYETLDFPESYNPYSPGPEWYPRLIICLILALCITHSLYIFKKGEDKKLQANFRLSIMCCLLTIIYIWIVPILGYFLATPIFMIVLLQVLKVRKWYTLVLVPLLFCLLTFLVFYKGLMIPLPPGEWMKIM